MSSGEVLFILLFIVLPTAILVSSAWAVVFVRRRPDRIVRQPQDEYTASTAESEAANQHTSVLETIETPRDDAIAANAEDEPVEEPSDQEFADEYEVEPEEETIVVTSELSEDATAAIEEPEAEPDPRPVETPVSQSTEDLDDVVKAVSSQEYQTEPEPDTEVDNVVQVEPQLEAESEPEPEAVPEAAEPTDEHLETSELPVVKQEPEQEPPRQTQELEEPRAGRPRRRQSVKLLPGDVDMPRQRGRNRDSQRQVPQLNRAFRRRDEGRSSVPPEPEDDPESTSARD